MMAVMMSRRALVMFAVASIAVAATSRRANALWMKQTTQKWPNGVVPVCMTTASINQPKAAQLRAYLEQAAAQFSNVARIKFVSRLPSCAGKPFDAANVCPSPLPPGTLVIDYSVNAFNSQVGYSPNFPTVSQMDPSLNLSSVYSCLSEMGHALGFEHEQDRVENIGGTLCPIGINLANQQVAQNHLRTQFDYWGLESYCRGTGSFNFTQRDVIGLKTAYGSRVSIGVFNAGGWWLDDGDGEPILADNIFRTSFGVAGDIPIIMRDLTTGGCANNGHSKVAVFRGGSQGLWEIDDNRSGVWDPSDPNAYFGTAGDRPVAGLFGGSPSFDEIGVLRGNGEWFMDADADRTWTGADRYYPQYGTSGDVPVAGAWAPQTSGWLGPPRSSNIGVFRNGIWFLDANGNGMSDSGDVTYWFGTTGDIPIVGDWNGDGRTKIGVYRNGEWFLDFNGNGVWDPDSDYGDVWHWYPQQPQPTDYPVVGDW